MVDTLENYMMLMFVAIINFFMAMSLNGFYSTDLFLPALFLYFISNLASFLEKKSSYKRCASHIEQLISSICFYISLFMVCGYLAYELHFINLNFQKANEVYHILIQGIPDSFITFSSLDVTILVIISIWIIPFSSVLLVIIPWLRSRGITTELVKIIVEHNKTRCIVISAASCGCGALGILVCRIKYDLLQSQIGTPQYFKYFIVSSATMALLLFTLLIYTKRNKYLFHNQEGGTPNE